MLVLAGSFRIASTWSVFNHTIDEPDTLAAGIEYLTTGRYLYEDTHPPLGRVFAALGPYLAGERFQKGPDSYHEGYRILGRGAHYDRVLALGRAGNLVFFWIASLVVYLWGWRAGGPKAALSATLLFTTLPPILAHAGLMTVDFALCAMTSAAALASLHWADLPNRGRSVLLGVAIALAFVSKFSALLYLPSAWLAMCVYHLAATSAPRLSLKEEGRLRDQFLINLRRFAQDDVPPASLSDYQSVDRSLNDVYQHIKQSSDSFWQYGTVKPSGIGDTEGAWLKLRDAWVEFARAAYPGLSADTVRTQITRLRLQQLEALQAR